MFVCKPVRAVPGPRAVGQAQVSLSSPHMPGLEPTSDTVTVSRTHAVQLPDSVRWSQSQEPKQKSPACETETSQTTPTGHGISSVITCNVIGFGVVQF